MFRKDLVCSDLCMRSLVALLSKAYLGLTLMIMKQVGTPRKTWKEINQKPLDENKNANSKCAQDDLAKETQQE